MKLGEHAPSKLQDIPREDLSQTLQLVYTEVQKADSSNYNYDLERLYMMLAALDRHLHENGAKYSIVKDQDFEESWKLLNGKAIDLWQQGKVKERTKQMPLHHLKKRSFGSGKHLVVICHKYQSYCELHH